MKSARRKKFAKSWKSAHVPRKTGRVSGVFFKLLVLALIILGVFLFVKIRTVYWNGHDKLAFAFKMTNGDVGVTVADPKLDDLTTFTIPGETEVDVAENFGTLRLKNVWQRSQNEKLKGRLLPETVTQNFLFPTFLWSDEDGAAIKDASLTGIVKFIFNPTGTNIPFGDRVSLGFFALKVPSLGKSEINLGQSQYLKKQILNDGQPGYVLVGPPPERLTVYFSDNDLSVTSARVGIVDSTGSPGVSDTVGQIVEVLGGKIVNVEKKNATATDCEVVGKDQKVVKKIMNLFNCKAGAGKTDFDLEIRIGSNFSKRF